MDAYIIYKNVKITLKQKPNSTRHNRPISHFVEVKVKSCSKKTNIVHALK